MSWRLPQVDCAHFKAIDVRSVPVNSDGPRFEEPLVNLDTTSIAHESYYARTDKKNTPFLQPIEGSRSDIWVRRTVAEMLVRADAWLTAQGFGLFVITGHTSPECLSGLWTFHLAAARNRRPEARAEDWHADAATHVRDPSLFSPEDPRTWPAHSSGAAVDVLLWDRSNDTLCDMGSSFEDLSEISQSDYFERQLDRDLLSPDDPRLCARRLLHQAMSREGFLNEPPLYWHFDWGNQLYVKTHGIRHGFAPAAAWYGFTHVPTED
jgi:D-alanyl-D-alanine dipeptidase